MQTSDRKIAQREMKESAGNLGKVDAEVEKTTPGQLIGRFVMIAGGMADHGNFPRLLNFAAKKIQRRKSRPSRSSCRFRGADLPLALAVALRGERGRAMHQEEADFWPVSFGDRFGRVMRFAKTGFHVRLTRANSYVADEHIMKNQGIVSLELDFKRLASGG